MIQLTVAVGPKFVGSIDMIKDTATRITKIVLGTAHGNREVTDKQITVSTVKASSRELSVNHVMFIITAEPDIADAKALEAARLQLKDVFDEAVAQVHPELRFVTLMSFNLERVSYKRRPSLRYPLMDEAAQRELGMLVQHLRDLLRKAS